MMLYTSGLLTFTLPNTAGVQAHNWILAIPSCTVLRDCECSRCGSCFAFLVFFLRRALLLSSTRRPGPVRVHGGTSPRPASESLVDSLAVSASVSPSVSGIVSPHPIRHSHSVSALPRDSGASLSASALPSGSGLAAAMAAHRSHAAAAAAAVASTAGIGNESPTVSLTLNTAMLRPVVGDALSSPERDELVGVGGGGRGFAPAFRFGRRGSGGGSDSAAAPGPGGSSSDGPQIGFRPSSNGPRAGGGGGGGGGSAAGITSSGSGVATLGLRSAATTGFTSFNAALSAHSSAASGGVGVSAGGGASAGAGAGLRGSRSMDTVGVERPGAGSSAAAIQMQYGHLFDSKPTRRR